jgi:transcription antitermination factor NusG
MDYLKASAKAFLAKLYQQDVRRDFCGGSAMTEDEIQRISRGIPNKNSRFTFRLGDTVRIKSGPFACFTAKVEGINQAKSLLKVSVNIFGRVRPVKLNFLEIEKASQ